MRFDIELLVVPGVTPVSYFFPFGIQSEKRGTSR